jgi:hypothetical protein
MNQTDKNNLRDALNDREESVMEMVGHSFQGRARWVSVIGWVKMLVAVMIAVTAIVQFFHTDSTRWLIAWASVFVVSSLGAAIMFALYWLEMNRNSITRELKRLELQIAQLREHN